MWLLCGHSTVTHITEPSPRWGLVPLCYGLHSLWCACAGRFVLSVMVLRGGTTVRGGVCWEAKGPRGYHHRKGLRYLSRGPEFGLVNDLLQQGQALSLSWVSLLLMWSLTLMCFLLFWLEVTLHKVLIRATSISLTLQNCVLNMHLFFIKSQPQVFHYGNEYDICFCNIFISFTWLLSFV